MPQAIKILIVEDDPNDAELLLIELQRAGFEPHWTRVDTEAGFVAQLDPSIELVLSDFQMPSFDGLRALQLLRERGLDIPFILVSGTIGEDLAVQAMKNGAADYLLKDRLVRLGPAVAQALAAHRIRRERRESDHNAERQRSELRILFDLIPAMVWFKDTGNRILQVNQRAALFGGQSVAEVERENALATVSRKAAEFGAEDLEVIQSGLPQRGIVAMHRAADGAESWLQTDRVPVRDKAGKVIGIVVMAQDITERKSTEQSLQLLNSAVMQSKESILITEALLDAPGPRILFVNPAFTAMTGYSAAEVQGKTPRLLQGPRTDRAVMRRLRQTLQAGDSFEGEAINYRKDGAEFLMEWQITPICTAAGVTTHYVAVQRDITERRKGEIATGRLAAIVESSDDAIYGEGLDGRITSWNRGAARIFGYTAEEIVGAPKGRLIPPGLEEEEIQMLEAGGRGRSLEHFETVRLTKDGRLIDISLTVSPLKSPAGAILGIAQVARDITERKRATESLRANEATLAVAQRIGQFGSWELDLENTDELNANALRWSDEMFRIAGLEPGSVAVTNEFFFSLVPAADHAAIEKAFANAIRERHTYSITHRLVRADGSVRIVSETAQIFLDDKTGRPLKVVGIAHDITDRRRLEEQIRESQKMDALGTLAGGIAHDFNNILTAINGYTELAQLALKENPVVRGYLGSVLQAAKRAAHLVRQILTFSRQEQLERRPTQLLPVVAETLNLLRATIPTTTAFDLSLASDAPVVFADPTQIHQILMNLGTNAWHAMKGRSGRLGVTLERFQVDARLAAATHGLQPGTYARISVSDTGSGMDPATLARIFEPFFTTKPTGEGTGLGLAVVHGIVDNHDGAITVDSQPGIGTVFRVYLPAFAGEALGAPSELGEGPRGNGERILVIDDEEPLAQLGQKTLSALGYEVEFATRPALALSMVRADPQRFALIVTDQTMPELTGLQLAERLQLIRPGLPIILMTGYAALVTPELAEAAGIRQVLIKPTSIGALGAAVHGALEAEEAKFAGV
jgi:PAS domain S-box-containing protein